MDKATGPQQHQLMLQQAREEAQGLLQRMQEQQEDEDGELQGSGLQLGLQEEQHLGVRKAKGVTGMQCC